MFETLQALWVGGSISSRLTTLSFSQSILLGTLEAVNILALRSEFNTPDETFPLRAHRRKWSDKCLCCSRALFLSSKDLCRGKAGPLWTTAATGGKKQKEAKKYLDLCHPLYIISGWKSMWAWDSESEKSKGRWELVLFSLGCKDCSTLCFQNYMACWDILVLLKKQSCRLKVLQIIPFKYGTRARAYECLCSVPFTLWLSPFPLTLLPQ